MPGLNFDDLSIYCQLGKRVAYLRSLKGLSQLDLALAAGLAPSFVSEVEKGKRNPSLKTLVRLSEALDVSLEELLRGIGPL